jgi:Natural resistance-associated macrophage protein
LIPTPEPRGRLCPRVWYFRGAARGKESPAGYKATRPLFDPHQQKIGIVLRAAMKVEFRPPQKCGTGDQLGEEGGLLWKKAFALRLWKQSKRLIRIEVTFLIASIGAFGTYTQAGQNYGTTLLWTLLLLVPVLYVNQEMLLRLGAVTGVGHARLILERFGKFWGAFSVIDLFLLIDVFIETFPLAR